MKTIKEIREALYAVNSRNVSMAMLALKQRDDKIVMDTNECLGEIIRWLDERMEEDGKAASRLDKAVHGLRDALVFVRRFDDPDEGEVAMSRELSELLTELGAG